MDEKMLAPVRKIVLDTNTYHGATIEPTLINFFFGKNGVGKSTIAARFKGDKSGISPDTSPYEILVYDQEFIKSNLQEDKAMPGVFSMNEEDIDKQNRISSKQEELGKARADYTAKKKEKEAKDGIPSILLSELENTFWRLTDSPRNKFPLAIKSKISGRITKASVCDVLLKESITKEADIDDLCSLYKVAFGADSTTYAELKKPRPIDEAKIDGFDWLTEEIISSSDKPYARFIKAIGATDWLKRSHDTFTGKADGKCPYCMKELGVDFEELFSSCFDEQYRQDVYKVQSFIAAYEKKVDAVIALLESNKSDAYPKIDFSAYDDKLRVLKTTIELNEKHLSEKADAPATTISLVSIDDQIASINTLIDRFNEDIKKYNEIIGSRKAKQTECIMAVWQHMAFLVKAAKTDYDKKIADNKAEVDKLKGELDKLMQVGKTLTDEITDLTKEIKGVDSTMIAINRMLRDSGFQGFHLKKKGNTDTDKNRYVIVRDDNTPAHGLSEGERNFIAFLYFYHKVWGRESPDTVFKDRIVVIDDPVSSMDSSSLFIVSSIIRELIGICFNNGSAARHDALRFIRQIFVLTHNAYFMQEISYDRIKYDHCVNFYLIKKNSNVSTITHCFKKDAFSAEPAIAHNYSPVQNSYAALWHEYKEVKSAIALKRVMRHILEYYFIQVSGFQGQELHGRIFKDASIFNDSSGIRDDTLIHSINMLLQYVGSDHQGFNAGFDYVDDTEDISSLKSTFEKIFEAMGQDQHYRMMMDTVKV